MDYDQALQNLTALNSWYRQNVTDLKRNEATTRLHLIDTLLFDCLDWDRKANCVAEERLEGLHAGRGEKHRGVIARRYERRRGHAEVLSLLEEGEEALAELGGGTHPGIVGTASRG